MKKIYGIVVAIVLSIVSILLMDVFLKRTLTNNLDKFIYYNNDSRNSVDFVMDKIVTKNSVVVLGSSELGSADELGYPPSLYNYGYSDYNLILIGRGYNQSLHQTIVLGSLQNNMKNNKIVLILSPQWFESSHLPSNLYSSRFIESNYIEFLKNKNISNSLKRKVANRLEKLIEADPKTKERMDLFESIYLYHNNLNPIDYIKTKIYDLFINLKLKFSLANESKKLVNNIDYDNFVKSKNINYKDLLKKAQQLGEKECTNNNYGIYNSYYNSYIKDDYEIFKNSAIDKKFTDSIEYHDLKIFLDLCKELDIEPLIISVPVNGKWYDYTGFSKEKREEYYENIRKISLEYGIELADFSDKEYEKYFLKDIMHLGWKGWIYLDEAIYNYYKK